MATHIQTQHPPSVHGRDNNDVIHTSRAKRRQNKRMYTDLWAPLITSHIDHVRNGGKNKWGPARKLTESMCWCLCFQSFRSIQWTTISFCHLQTTWEREEETVLPWSRTWFVFPTCIYFLLVEGWLRRVLYSLKGSLLSCPRNGTNCTLRPLAGWGVPCVIFYSMHSRDKILQRSAWFPATNIRDSVQGPFQSLWLSLFFFCFSLYVFDIPRIVFCLMSARFSVIAFLACYNKKFVMRKVN